MKKTIIAVIISAIIISLTACSSKSSGSETSEISSESIGDSSTTESSVASTIENSIIEEVSEIESEEPQNEEADSDSVSDEGETTDIQIDYMGISFIVPDEADYKESNSDFTITFEPQKRVAVIEATDVSDIDNDELASVSNLFAINSAMEAYEETQNEDTSHITIAGVTGISTTALVKVSDTWLSAAFVAFSNEDFTYTYCISYISTTDSESNHSDYADFLDSISFN